MVNFTLRGNLIAIIAIVVSVFGLEKQVNATSYTWAGGSSGAWATDANWTPNTGYPGSTGNADIAVFANGTYSVSAVPSKTITTLQISNAGGAANVTLTPTANNTLTVTNFTVASGCALTLAANLTVTISGTSTFANSGTVSGPGTIQFRSTATFPNGTGSGGAFGATGPSIILNGNNQTVTLDGSTDVSNLTINNNTGLVLNNFIITLNGTFSNSARNSPYGLVGPGTILFNATNSFPAGGGNNGVFSTNGTVYPSVTVANGIAVTNTASTSIGTLTVNSTGSLTINNGSTLTLTGTLSNSGAVQGQSAAATGTILFKAATSFPQGSGTGGTFSSADPLRVTVSGAITVAADASATISTLTINNVSGILNDGGNTVTVLGAVANSGTHNSTTGGSITLTGSTAGHALTGGGSYGNLTLNDAKGAALNANATVNGALTLSSGILDAGSNGDTVFISSTGSASSSGGWVNGFLAEYFASSGSPVSKTFEVGDNTGDYRPVTVTFTSVSTPGYLIISNTPGAFTIVPMPASFTQDVAAYWTLINHSITFPAATVAFNYLPGDISGTQSKFVAETYVIDGQNTNYGNWLAGWTSTNPTGTSTVASGVTTFGDFVIGDSIEVPVQITTAGPLTFCAGGSVVLHSSISIAGNYAYNWYQNSTALNSHGVTDTAATSGLYYLQIKNTSNNNLYYSDSLLVTVIPLPTVQVPNSLAPICPGATTPALGGSFGGDATGAVWSDGGAGGTFANNGGLTPNAATYTSLTTASSPVTLTLTTSGGSCGTTNASVSLPLKVLPVSPGLYYESPARLCGGVPVLITDTSAAIYNNQWTFNGSPIAGATSKQVSADSAGVYDLTVTDPSTGCSNISSSVAVDQMPYIVPDTIFLPCTSSGDTTISTTNPVLFSYSTLPAACNVDMTNASIITSTVTAGGTETWIICSGGNVTDSYSGSNTYVVEPGGVLNGYGGGGSNTAYVKAGGTFNYTGNGTPGDNTVYYEPGATVSASMGAYTVIQCTQIGVIYPPNIALCVPFTYLWSTGDTTPSISVNPPLTTTYYVTVSEGNYNCTDSVVVFKTASTATISSIPNSVCQGSSVVLTLTGSSGAVQWQSSVTTAGFNDIPGAVDTSYTTTPAQTTYFRVYGPNASASCLDTTTIFELPVNPLPAPPALTAANDSICSGDSTQVCAPDTFSGYLWNTGATTSCTSALNAGGYWVSVTAADGCPTVSDHADIYVYPASSVSIQAQGDTLSSFGAVAYQWFLNTSMINGATDSVYVAKQSGNYSVEITDSYGCLATSSPLAITITGVTDLLSGMVFEVYPNPASSDVQIKIGSEWIGKEYELYDVCGKMVTTGIARNEISIIDVSAMAKGAYFIKMNGYVRKFMKL